MDAGVHDADVLVYDVLLELLDETRRIRQWLAAHGGDRKSEAAKDQVDVINLKTQGGTSRDYIRARLLTEITRVLHDLDVPITSDEVTDARLHDHALDDALTALHVTDSASLGRVLRSMNGKAYGDLMIVSDGRTHDGRTLWRLRRPSE